ncbi:MAG: helix-turn-helix domain-containing protein [Alphaproteobacteria bacterium]|nr:MAG: helix-turn-helix domain-containing protein [Alphaproteobacteria bacterium]
MLSKDFYSTGEVSDILSISRATVSRKFDSGIFKGKKNPITGERLISHESLVAFMRRYNLSLIDVSPKQEKAVLLGSNDQSIIPRIQNALSEISDITLYVTESGYDALIKCSVLQPDLFIIDEGLSDINCVHALDSLDRQNLKNSMKTLCLTTSLHTHDSEQIKADSCLLKDTLTNDMIVDTILTLVNLKPQNQSVPRFNHKRQFPRIPVSVPANVEVYLSKSPEYREQGTTKIENISLGGAFLSDIQLQKGQIPFGNFRIHLETDQPPLNNWHAECKIIRLRANGSVNAGVEFVNINQFDRSKISELVQ